MHFEEGDYDSENYGFYKEVDDVEYWLGSVTDSYHGAEKNQGTPGFRYVDLNWSYVDDTGEDDEGALQTRAAWRTVPEQMPPPCPPAARATPASQPPTLTSRATLRGSMGNVFTAPCALRQTSTTVRWTG